MKKTLSYSKSAILLTIIVILSMVISFGKEIVFAAYFGTSSEADAFSIASHIPVSLFAIVSTSINTVVIPLYSRAYEKKGKDEANKFYSILTSLVTIFSIVVCLIFIIFSDFFIGIFSPGLDDGTKLVASNILKIMMCLSIFSCYIQINNGILNYNKVFATTRLLNNLRNITAIIFLIALYNKFGIYAMASGFVIGMGFEAIISFFMTRKYCHYKPCFNVKNEFIKQTVRMIIPIIIGTGTTELCAMINQIIASYMSPGSLAIVNYSNRMITTISTLTIASIETVVYPSFSKTFNSKNYDEMKKLFSNSLVFIILMTLPIMVGGMIISKEIISVVFERGGFNHNDTLNVSSVFMLSLPGFLFMSIRSIIAKLYYASGRTHIPMISAVIKIILTVIMNAILIFGLKFNFIAFGISSSLSSLFSLLFIYLKAKKDFKISFKMFNNDGLKVLLSTILMAMILLGLKNNFDTAHLNRVLKLVIYISLPAMFYAGSLFAFGVQFVRNNIKFKAKKHG